MTIKKTAIYSSLWSSSDELRGGMDASQYKDYVLTLEQHHNKTRQIKHGMMRQLLPGKVRLVKPEAH